MALELTKGIPVELPQSVPGFPGFLVPFFVFVFRFPVLFCFPVFGSFFCFPVFGVCKDRVQLVKVPGRECVTSEGGASYSTLFRKVAGRTTFCR